MQYSRLKVLVLCNVMSLVVGWCGAHKNPFLKPYERNKRALRSITVTSIISCGQSRSAVLACAGGSSVVAVGQMCWGYCVQKITPTAVVLIKDGSALNLELE